MSEKKILELEYLLKTSVKVFENLIFTPSGLGEWFADDINIVDDIYNFHWDGSDEQARLKSKKIGTHIRWQWIVDEENDLDTFFEIKYEIDSLTNTLVLRITDYATEEDFEETKMLWESAVVDLKRVLGA